MPPMTRESTPAEPLQRYREKRNFDITPEPGPQRARRAQVLSFVVQKH